MRSSGDRRELFQPQAPCDLRPFLVLTLGEERYELSSSDSVLLDQSDASWENQGRSRTEILVVSVRTPILKGR